MSSTSDNKLTRYSTEAAAEPISQETLDSDNGSESAQSSTESADSLNAIEFDVQVLSSRPPAQQQSAESAAEQVSHQESPDPDNESDIAQKSNELSVSLNAITLDDGPSSYRPPGQQESGKTAEQVSQQDAPDLDNGSDSAQNAIESAASLSVHALEVEVPSYRPPTQQESGISSTEKKNTGMWLKGMKQRQCLLIYEDHPTFKTDCKSMETVLTRCMDDCNCPGTVDVVSVNNFLNTHIYMLLKTEEIIVQKMLDEYLLSSLPDIPEKKVVELLVHYTYSGFRVLKARQIFQQRRYLQAFFVANQSEKTEKDCIDQLVSIIFNRWVYFVKVNTSMRLTTEQKSGLLVFLAEMNICAKKLAGVRKLAFKGNETSFRKLRGFARQQTKTLKELAAEFSLSSDIITGHADTLFRLSIYCSGYPAGRPVRGDRVSEDFSKVYNTLQKLVFKEVDESRDITTRIWDFNSNHEIITECLATNKQTADLWLWIYYSGHNIPGSVYTPCLPILSLNDVMNAFMDLFNNVVICMDCCFPDANRPFSAEHITAIFACPSNQTTTYNRTKDLSYFTEQLASVLNGCDPMSCPFKETQDYEICQICQLIRQDIAQKGFIFPADVEEFFKKHKVQRYVHSHPNAKPVMPVLNK